MCEFVRGFSIMDLECYPFVQYSRTASRIGVVSICLVCCEVFCGAGK